MKRYQLIIGFCFVVVALVAGWDNLFFQPATPGMLIGSVDLIVAFMTLGVLLGHMKPAK